MLELEDTDVTLNWTVALFRTLTIIDGYCVISPSLL